MKFYVPSKENISVVIKTYQEFMKQGYSVKVMAKKKQRCVDLDSFTLKYHFAISFRKRAWETYGKSYFIPKE